MNLNKVMIIGNLTRDPEVRTTPQGATVASFSVATNMTWKDAAGAKQEKVEFHNIVAWRGLADVCGKYLHKGSKVYVEGRLQTRDWAGQDGVKRYRTEIVMENMEMLDRKGAATGGAPSEGEQPARHDDGSQPSPAAGEETIEEEIKVEDIPF